MRKSSKRILVSIFLILALVVIFFKVCDYVIASKLNDYLKNNVSETIKLDYDQLSVSSWQGRLTLTNPSVIKTGKTTDIEYLKLEIDTLMVDGVGYWDYLFNNKITIEKVLINSPKAVYNYNKSSDVNASKESMDSLKRVIGIKQFQITNGDISIVNEQTDSLLLRVENGGFNLSDIAVSDSLLKRKIPFDYNAYQFSFDTMFYRLNDFDNLTLGTSKINTDYVLFSEIKIRTKYSKQTLSNHLKTERDHFNITIDSIAIQNQNFGFAPDSTFYFKAPKTILYKPDANIYRDKLVANDLTVKKMYSNMLRSLNFDLTLNDVAIQNANINYSERTKANNSGGEISFSKFQAKLLNVSNTYVSPEKTTIDVVSNFMGNTPIKADWSFDINNPNDAFEFNARIGDLPVENINKFSEPNLHIRFEGDILETMFTITGNTNTSRVDLKTKYHEFDIVALRKDGERKNKLLTDVINIFVSKSSDKAPDNFKLGYKEKVVRDKTKSIFNFMWLNVKAGLLDAMTRN